MPVSLKGRTSAAASGGSPDHNACCREAIISSNAAVVLQTLVPQAREIFKLLAQAQLSGESEEEGSEGVPNVSLPALHQESLEPY